jgi:hypothetical protein
MAQPESGFAIRQERIKARKELLARITPRYPAVRVNPKDDDLRRVLKHPSGIAFPATGSVEWPNDKFTRKRIADGSVTVADMKQEHAAPHPQQRATHN